MEIVKERVDSINLITAATVVSEELVKDMNITSAVVLMLDNDGFITIGYSNACRCSVMNILGDATIIAHKKIVKECESCVPAETKQ